MICDHEMVDAWTCLTCAMASTYFGFARIDPDPYRPSFAANHAQRALGDLTAFEAMQHIRTITAEFADVSDRPGWSKRDADHVDQQKKSRRATRKLLRFGTSTETPRAPPGEKFHYALSYEHHNGKRKRRRKIMGQANRVPQPSYTRKFHISRSAIDRFRGLVDHHMRSKSDGDLGNLIDERMRASTEREAIVDHIADKHEGRHQETWVVRLNNQNQSHCFAVLRENTCVTVLSPEMANSNFASKSWSRGAMNSPFTKETLAGVVPVVPAAKNVDVGRRTISVMPTDEAVDPVGPWEIAGTHPVASGKTLFDQVVDVIHDATKNGNEVAVAIPVADPSRAMTKPTPLEAIARELEDAAAQVSQTSVELEAAQVAHEEAKDRLKEARYTMNAKIAEISGMPIPPRPSKPEKVPEKPMVDAPREPQKYTEADRSRYVELVKNGRSAYEVAAEHNLTYSTLRSWCIKAGVMTSPGGK